MTNFTIEMSTKDLRRAAFAVGFGLVVGKAVGRLASSVINGITAGITTISLKELKKYEQNIEEKTLAKDEE